MIKLAFTGASGSGKTTLVKFVEKELGLKHISGSAGDIKTIPDQELLQENEPMLNIEGHLGVIINSAYNSTYGLQNQEILIQRRGEIIEQNEDFVTDRSPVDNFTYLVNQVGFHPEITDDMLNELYYKCLEHFSKLTHLVYVKSVQPYDIGVENNGSRIHNWFYQQSIDAQFHFWLNSFTIKAHEKGLNIPKIMCIDYWDLQTRKDNVKNFLSI